MDFGMDGLLKPFQGDGIQHVASSSQTLASKILSSSSLPPNDTVVGGQQQSDEKNTQQRVETKVRQKVQTAAERDAIRAQLEQCMGEMFSRGQKTRLSAACGGWSWWWWLLQFSNSDDWWYWIMWYFLSRIFLAGSNNRMRLIHRTPQSLAVADQLRISWWPIAAFGFLVWLAIIFTAHWFGVRYDTTGIDLGKFSNYNFAR